MEKIIIFGRGNYYSEKKEYLEKNYEIVAFIDNAIKENEQRIDEELGVPIVNPKQIAAMEEAKIFLASVKWFSMWKQLMEMEDIDESRIVFGVSCPPSYDRSEKIFLEAGVEFSSRNRQLVMLKNGKEQKIITTEVDYKRAIGELYCTEVEDIKRIKALSVYPVSDHWGNEHGKPIDRYYIEQFLDDNRQCITGKVLEVAEDLYTTKYGHDIEKSLKLHVNGWGEDVLCGNLATGEGIPENEISCFVCTQTLQFIFEMEEAVKNIFKLLKKDGTALVTIHSIAEISMYDYRNWGEYWRVTKQSAQKLFEKYFDKDKLEIQSFGNVKVATAMLYGLAVEDLEPTDFEYNDEQYPIIVTIKATK